MTACFGFAPRQKARKCMSVNRLHKVAAATSRWTICRSLWPPRTRQLGCHGVRQRSYYQRVFQSTRPRTIVSTPRTQARCLSLNAMKAPRQSRVLPLRCSHFLGRECQCKVTDRCLPEDTFASAGLLRVILARAGLPWRIHFVEMPCFDIR